MVFFGSHQCHHLHGVWHRQAEGQKREMAHTGSHLAPTGHRWREHWGLDRYESLASQDHAQEVQIWRSFDFDDTNRALSLLDSPIKSPYHFLYHQPKTQPATRNFATFIISRLQIPLPPAAKKNLPARLRTTKNPFPYTLESS